MSYGGFNFCYYYKYLLSSIFWVIIDWVQFKKKIYVESGVRKDSKSSRKVYGFAFSTYLSRIQPGSIFSLKKPN